MNKQRTADVIRLNLARLRDWLLARSLEFYVAFVGGGMLGFALRGIGA